MRRPALEVAVVLATETLNGSMECCGWKEDECGFMGEVRWELGRGHDFGDSWRLSIRVRNALLDAFLDVFLDALLDAFLDAFLDASLDAFLDALQQVVTASAHVDLRGCNDTRCPRRLRVPSHVSVIMKDSWT